MALDLRPANDLIRQAVTPGTDFGDAQLSTTGFFFGLVFQYDAAFATDDDLFAFENAADSGDLYRIRTESDDPEQVRFSFRRNGGTTTTINGKNVVHGEWMVATARVSQGSGGTARQDTRLWVDGEAVVESLNFNTGSAVQFATAGFDQIRIGSVAPGFRCVGAFWGRGDPAAAHAWIWNEGGDIREPSAYDWAADTNASLEGYWSLDRITPGAADPADPEMLDAVAVLDPWTVDSGAQFDDLPAPWGEAAPPIGDPGEIVSGGHTLLANGREATITIAGMSAASLTAQENDDLPGLAFACATTGFNATLSAAAVAKTRTGIACKFKSASTISGGILVTVTLSESIHADDTSVTFTAEAGVFNDGEVTSAETTDAAVTNNSELPYAIPAISVVSPLECPRITGAYYVDVVACAGAYGGHRANMGIARVEVQIAENGGLDIDVTPARTVTKSSATPVLIDDPTGEGPYAQIVGWRVGPFSNADFDGGALDHALLRIRATAYPLIGDTGGADADQFAFNDPTNDYDVRHAVVDPVGGSDSTGRIAAGHGLAGLSSTADDNPYQTIHEALYRLSVGDGTLGAQANTRSSYSVIYLVAGDHTLGTYSFGKRTSTIDGPVIIRRHPDATRAQVRIIGSADSSGLKTNATRLEEVTLRLDEGSNGVAGSVGALSTAGALGGGPHLYLFKVDQQGPGRAEVETASLSSNYVTRHRIGGAIRDVHVSAVGRKAVGFTVTNYSQDIASYAAVSNVALVNFQCLGGDPEGTEAHVDAPVQINGDVTNMVVWQGIVGDSNGVQGPLFGNGGGSSHTVERCGYFGVIHESDGGSGGGQLINLDFDGAYFYHVSADDSFLLIDTSGEYRADNFWVVASYFANVGGTITDNIPVTGWFENHRRNAPASFPATFEETSGGTLETLFTNWPTTYRPLAGGPLVGRTAERVSPFYPDGSAVTEGDWAIGAVGPALAASGRRRRAVRAVLAGA